MPLGRLSNRLHANCSPRRRVLYQRLGSQRLIDRAADISSGTSSVPRPGQTDPSEGSLVQLDPYTHLRPLLSSSTRSWHALGLRLNGPTIIRSFIRIVCLARVSVQHRLASSATTTASATRSRSPPSLDANRLQPSPAQFSVTMPRKEKAIPPPPMPNEGKKLSPKCVVGRHGSGRRNGPRRPSHRDAPSRESRRRADCPSVPFSCTSFQGAEGVWPARRAHGGLPLALSARVRLPLGPLKGRAARAVVPDLWMLAPRSDVADSTRSTGLRTAPLSGTGWAWVTFSPWRKGSSGSSSSITRQSERERLRARGIQHLRLILFADQATNPHRPSQH